MRYLSMLGQAAGRQDVNLLIALAVAGLVMAAWLMFVIVWRRRRGVQEKKVEERLGLTIPDLPHGRMRVLRLWHDGKEATTAVPMDSRPRTIIGFFEQLRRQAGWTTPAQGILMALVGATLLVFVGTYAISGHLLPALAGAAGLLLVFWAYVKYRANRRTALFERQFVSALELAARSLRAGHPLMGACRLISEEIGPPVGPIFTEVVQQQEMGVNMETALRQAAARSTSDDMKLFATSVAIQLRSGGNLADMMDMLSLVIRDRMRLSRRIRVLTAQTQFSKWILAALPLVLFAVLNIINPDYVQPFYTTWNGKLLLGLAGLGVVSGVYVMNRMAVLRF